MNGGQVALTGFTLQVVWAVLDGLERDDWTSMTIEPGDTEGSFEKVDVRWELPGAERHDQVKGTTGTFGRAQVTAWAQALEAGSAGADLRLVLLGVPSSGIAGEERVGRVDVVVCPRDERVLRYAASYMMERACRRIAVQPTYGRTEEALERLVGVLLQGAARGRRWSREQLLGLMRELTSEPRRSDLAVVDPVVRAERVQSTMRIHGMTRMFDHIRRGSQTVFRFCEWPPPPYADIGGYHETVVRRGSGPGDCEATGCCESDRIVSASAAVELRYLFQGMGAHILGEPFVARPGDVLRVTGKSYDGAHGPLGFTPELGEIVVLRNGKHTLDRVRCLER